MADDKKRGEDYTIEMNERNGDRFEPPKPSYKAPAPTSSLANHPLTPLLAYCASSIMMTVLNKYVLSADYNLNLLLLCVQVGDLRY